MVGTFGLCWGSRWSVRGQEAIQIGQCFGCFIAILPPGEIYTLYGPFELDCPANKTLALSAPQDLPSSR